MNNITKKTIILTLLLFLDLGINLVTPNSIIPNLSYMFYGLLIASAYVNPRDLPNRKSFLSSFLQKDILSFTFFISLFYSIITTSNLLLYLLVCLLIFFISSFFHTFILNTFFETLLFFISTVFAKEVLLYLVYKFSNFIDAPFQLFLIERLTPTLIFNTLSSVAIYTIYKHFLSENNKEVVLDEFNQH